MTSITNMFLNFNYLTKMDSDTKNIEYNKKNIDLSISTPALTQGNKFKKYQKNIKKDLEENADELSGKEGFEGLNLNNLNLDANGLTKQSNNIVTKNDFSSGQKSIDTLRQQYDNTLKEYEKLIAQINGSTTGYLDRIDPSNPYLGKNINFTTGETAYVTQQGVVKLYPKNAQGIQDILLGTVGKNGCPTGKTMAINLPWLSKYNSPGINIPSKPPLVTGTPMVKGQSCGNEGKNVFVNALVNNPESSYIGCYNNTPPATEIMFIPVMGSSSGTNGFKASASSVYNNDNNFTGAWRAFDNNVNTWWHSSIGNSNTTYNNSTGVYNGTNGYNFINPSGQKIYMKGEFLQIYLPNAFPLTKYSIQGRQGCCGNPNGRDPNTWYIIGYNTKTGTGYQIDYQTNVSFNFQMKTFSISDPKPYDSYVMLITVAGDPKANTERYCVQIATWNLYTSSNYVTNAKPAMTNIGKMSYDQCQTYALTSGNKYFAIQDVDSNSNGNCMISNDLTGAQMYGISNNYNTIALWASGTNNKGGTTAKLSENGSLSIFNSSSQVIFSTPGDKISAGGYIGCYKDTSIRAMTNTSNNQYLNLDQCRDLAVKNKMKYYGAQDAHGGDNGWCVGSNDLASAQKYGLANNCTKNSKGNLMGGPWSNAIYSADQKGTYYLILQDDGNMVVYRGSSPSDNQGVIWASGTNGKQQQPNPNYTANKGKYGKNWIAVGTSLAPNDFVGSNNGNIYLIMQTDGNLVLYTSTPTNSCSVSKNLNGKTVGNQNINALYQLTNIGLKSNMGKVAYIDEDSKLHSYPNNNVQYNTTYTKIKGVDSAGNDIPGSAYGNATLDKCETSCNNNSQCTGFVYTSDNTCWPKNSNMYPNGSIQINNKNDLYIRDKNPITPPIGVTNITNKTDSISYQNYINGGNLDKQYGLVNATSIQKQQLAQLQTRMNLLSSQISDLTTRFGNGSNTAEFQSKTNVKGIGNYLTELNNTNIKITNFPSSMDNILDDSDIVVLQKNYDYYFWTILAAGTVVVSMNIVKQ